jgi:Fe2+ or Zn2+ uptake regulation protein
MPTIVPRDEQLKRAAQIRAVIVSTLNNNPNPITRSDLYVAIQQTMESLNYDEGSLDNFLYTMTKSGLITKANIQGGKAVYAASGVTIPVKKTVIKPEKHSKKDHPAITIDIVKSTGRVRVAFNGLVVEIGVIN